MLKLDAALFNIKGYFYLAHPYSHATMRVRKERWRAALTINGMLMSRGLHIYNPIHSTHEIAQTHQLPYEHEFWIQFNKYFIDGSSAIIALKLSGWEQSRGVAQELAYAERIGKPVFWLDEKGNSV